MQNIIQIHTQPQDVILDPFMGVGSTGVAALELDRKFGGCEIDYSYYSASEKRLKGVSKQ